MLRLCLVVESGATLGRGAQASHLGDFSSLLSTGSGMRGLEQRQHSGSVAVHTGLAALRHVGSSWARDRTHVPCIARRIVKHWTTREALNNPA